MKLSRNFLCSSELSRNGVDIAWDGNLSAKIKMITAELSVGSQKTIKKEDTTEEIFGFFGINILDKFSTIRLRFWRNMQMYCQKLISNTEKLTQLAVTKTRKWE